MSGHSHWSSIKYRKEIADKKRGKAFSKLSRQISVAAREKGGDLNVNSALRLAVGKAKELNMSKENIERAIKKGTGELEGVQYEEVIYEAYGPGGIAIIIEGITDNRNRTLGEIKQLLSHYNGKLVNEGSVKWMFEKKGVITIKEPMPVNRNLKEGLELKAIEAGAQDLCWHKNSLDVYTKAGGLEEVKKNLENRGVKVKSASMDWVAKDMVKLEGKDQEGAQKLFEALDENEAIQEIYSNLSS